MATGGLMGLLAVVGGLIIAWVLVERFAPDPTLALIAKIIIFLAMVGIVLMKLLPMAGIHI